ncbi:MAG: aminoacyl-tRNA hydrolase [Geobacteraceae bacterium GWC2_55_20]|nr:MAG: aminoacyl-tRNA hydrolase [Geobacteraceae bacterium GWC2_55_20]OGU26589.1 MAG: aminoacyl-tRNA hydrolase [Geobacteraceae bacterium GWF2_54_21]HBA71812.1 aminoacyl-tRNA hydrolase [Geobacter sp.]HCE66191.1 aminoacyl-tRNA hydrolase [Geobacter sp.]
MNTFIIAGLGNPGPTYQWTRHNAGFLFLDRLASSEKTDITRKSFSGLTGEWNYAGHRLVLLKPLTFMNLSGKAVMQALQFYKLPISQLIVIHDELDLPYGTVRFKQGGGHGGHNGLRSITEQLGKNDFIRLRIGIGKSPHGDTTGHVLGNIPPVQMEHLSRILDGGINMLKMMLDEGISKAMSLNNNKNFLEG